VSKEKSVCLLLILIALAIGALAGRSCSHTATIMVMDSAKHYPGPRNGDKLKWVHQSAGHDNSVQWHGPPSSGISPCKEQESNENAKSDTCTVNYHSTNFKVYHYTCEGCGDPGVGGGTGSNGGGTNMMDSGYWTSLLGSTKSNLPVAALRSSAPTGGKEYFAEAGFNPATSASGVWYFSPDGTADGFVPIKVSAKSTASDQVIWEPVGDAAWTVVVAPKTCVEPTTTFSSSGSSTCTIASTATSQYYCVIFGTTGQNPALQAGNAVLLVDDPTGANLPTNQPPATCTLPAKRP